MISTINESTVKVGQSQATVLARSCHEDGSCILTTWELVYPRYILAQLNTHRMFSRNSASSRATPTHVLANEVAFNPAFFDSLTTNQRGMVGGAELSEEDAESFKIEWNGLANEVAKCAIAWKKRYNLSKQIINRILEPFMFIRTIVTATEVDNFFKLRLAPDAQPEIQSLAKAMKESMEKVEPRRLRLGQMHLPYIDEESLKVVADIDNAVTSIAACARVSVVRGDGRHTTLTEDTEFVERLAKAGHLSPFEHVAVCALADDMYANLRGWRSIRYGIDHVPELETIINAG